MILSYSLINNMVIIDIAPPSNLIFSNNLLAKTGSSAQSYSYYKSTSIKFLYVSSHSQRANCDDYIWY